MYALLDLCRKLQPFIGPQGCCVQGYFQVALGLTTILYVPLSMP
jgi:hypothetical protein